MAHDVKVGKGNDRFPFPFSDIKCTSIFTQKRVK